MPPWTLTNWLAFPVTRSMYLSYKSDIAFFIMAAKSLTASAPGKVLICGGYLVLFPQYVGCVIAMDTRFYVTIEGEEAAAGSTVDHTVIVKSPQFTNSRRIYRVRTGENNHVSISNDECSDRNPFIDTCITVCLRYVCEVSCDTVPADLNVSITITADNAFYSQVNHLQSCGLAITWQNLCNIPKRNNLGCDVGSVQKTGLGSSAAMTTALVAAIVKYFLPSGCDTEVIHNLAQLCHCIAQGKVGSGFDVSAAIFGSQLFQRCNSGRVLDQLMKSFDNYSCPISELINSKWGFKHTAFRLPKGLRLVLGDVQCGSNTPNMVSKVLAWKRANPELSDELFQALDKQNSTAVSLLQEISTHEDDVNYDICLQSEASSAHGNHSIDSNLVSPLIQELRLTFQIIREMLRKLTDLTCTPIEPPEQSRILDECLRIPGVIFAGVPGAGGFDAIFCVTIDTPTTFEKLSKIMEMKQIVALDARSCPSGLDFSRSE